MNIKITDLVLSLLLVVMFFVSFYLFVYKPKQKDIETITNVVTIHDTVYSHKADTIHDTVVKIKRVVDTYFVVDTIYRIDDYISGFETVGYKLKWVEDSISYTIDIPSTVLFKKE
jgi:preprotein translocase subunit YajC